MKINRHNYEEYLLDFIEGKLSEAEAIAVNSFLDKNPDLKLEAEELLNCKLGSENFNFNNKEALKKDLSIDIEGIIKFEQLSIAFLENDITSDQKLQLDAMLKKSETKQHEHKILQQTRLSADLNITFRNKGKLKQYQLNNTRKKLYFITSLAASIALLAAIILFKKDKENFYALAFENYHSGLKVSRYYYEKETINTLSVEKVKYENREKKMLIIDSIPYTRENFPVAIIDIKQAKQIELNNNSAMVISTEIYTELVTQTASADTDNIAIEDYVSKTLFELGVDQENEKKSILAAAGKSVAQFIGKIFKKNIQIEKKEIEDGRKLYAIRAGSLEFYTSIKSKNKPQGEKEIINGE